MIDSCPRSQDLPGLQPRLHPEQYVFCYSSDLDQGTKAPYQACFYEEHGISMLMNREDADRFQLGYKGIYAMITLEIFSDLASVGLTAKVSTALADAQIACNIIAAYHHDHLLVPFASAQKALQVLQGLVVEK